MKASSSKGAIPQKSFITLLTVMGVSGMALSLTGCLALPAALLPDKEISPARTLQARGVAAEYPDDQISPSQRQLIAKRAATLTAIRNLAEQVYGLQINGQTTVTGLVVEKEDVRTFVDAYLAGVRVVEVAPQGTGIYEAVVELNLGDDFFACLRVGQCALTEKTITAVHPPPGSPLMRPVRPCSLFDCYLPLRSDYEIHFGSF